MSCDSSTDTSVDVDCQLDAVKAENEDKLNIVEIHRKTKDDILRWTHGTAETKALGVILDKFRNGAHWVTITGAPGEGKATMGYMVLRNLSGVRSVYSVRSPKQFDEITATIQAPVILLHDIFDHAKSDEDAFPIWQQWRDSFGRFLKTMKEKPKTTVGTVVLIGRAYVFKSGFRLADNPWEAVNRIEHVVNLSRGKRSNTERMNIWKCVAERHDVHLDRKPEETISGVYTPHGYPHTCHLFATFFKKGKGISAAEFFRQPLRFLKRSLEVVIKEKVIENIFKAIVTGGGWVSRNKLGKYGSEYIRTANDLQTYIKSDGDGYSFDHQSILETVMVLLCESNPTFILEQCSLEFIIERVRLGEEPTGFRSEDGQNPVAHVAWADAEALMNRYLSEMDRRNLWRLEGHDAWRSNRFVALMIKTMSRIQLNMVDGGRCMRLVERLCMEQRPDCVKLCLQSGAGLGWRHWGGKDIMHWAAQAGHTDVVRLLLEMGVSVNVTSDACTPLHHAAAYGHVDTVRVLVEAGADVEQRNSWQQTASDCALDGGHSEILTLLMNKTKQE